jgi:hypothetical protein
MVNIPWSILGRLTWVAPLALTVACKSTSTLTEAEAAALEYSGEQIGEVWNGTMVYDHPDNPFLQEIPSERIGSISAPFKPERQSTRRQSPLILV